MRSVCRWIWCAAVGVIAVTGVARGADAPLLVSVEITPGLDVGPADVRRTVATELGAPVVGAWEEAAADTASLLLVDVAPREVRMSLRTGAMPVVSRTIASPVDRPGRLRSIGWLAGNLVRDQVGPLVATAAAPAPMPSAAEARPPTEPPPVPSGATSRDSAGPAAVVASRPPARDDAVPHARWAITAGAGPALNVTHFPDYTSHGETYFTRGTVYQIEVQHQASPDTVLLGAALEIGPNAPNRHYFGAAAFAGSRWSRRSWFVEANLGVGLEVLDEGTRNVTVTSSSDMLGTLSQTTVSSGPVPEFFARGTGAVGVNLTQSFDMVVQLGAHLSSEGQLGSYLSSTIGVRMRLP